MVPRNMQEGQESFRDDGLHEPFVVSLLTGAWIPLLRAALLWPFGHAGQLLGPPLLLSNSPSHLLHLNCSWQTLASLFFLNLLHLVSPLLRCLGAALVWLLNFLQLNGGFLRILFLLAFFRWDLVTWNPPKDSPSYYSVIGWLDTRLDLIDTTVKFKEPNTQSFVHLCIMASKLAYESPQVQQHVLEFHWNMCFRKFFDCWNDRAQLNTTEAFIFTDKPENADLVFVAFRGTEPFDADDWGTDFDFAWLQLSSEVGKVHLGFLEALGLVNRQRCTTFDCFKQNCLAESAGWKYDTCHSSLTTGLLHVEANEDKILAFDAINEEVGRLLLANPMAKLFLTGHSLGGALAVLFAGILMFKTNRNKKEDNILEKLCAIHTFGQPRVGDRVFANFMNRRMKALNIDYYRIVYSDDMVSRIPFDDCIFGYKHVGNVCYYYDSFFTEEDLKEVPNKNFFSPRFAFQMWIDAMWELVRSVAIMTCMYGKDFKETTMTIMLRMFGLVFPGVSAHMPVNYVSAVRLGPQILNQYRVNSNIDS